MKFQAVVFTLAAAFTASATAASITDLPSCATNCAGTSFTSAGSCSSTDIKCICSTPSFITTIGTCVEKACSKADVEKTLTVAESICKDAGVTIESSVIASITASPTKSASGAISTGSSNSTSSSASNSSSAVSSAKPTSSTSTGGAAAIGLSGLTIGGAVAAFFFL